MKNLTKFLALSVIAALVANSSGFTCYAMPTYAFTVEAGEDDDDARESNSQTDQTDQTEETSADFYLLDDLPDIVAVNRILDSEIYGNESYFLAVTDLSDERTYYDHTGTLTAGENNHLSPKFDPQEDLKVHGGQELRITLFYDNNSRIPLFPYVGSGFFPSLKTGETGTIWGQVYLLDSVGYTNSGIGGEDRVYNVVPIVAKEDVYLEYIDESLVRYGIGEDFRDGTPVANAALKHFFQEDIEETGLQMFYLNEDWDDPHEYMGYVTYKIRVVKQPNGWNKAEAAANTAKDKVSDMWHSEPAEKAKEAFTDFMTGLGNQASAWLNR